MRYRGIDRRRNRYSVRMMCGALRVSRSGYHAWRVRPESRRARRNRELTRIIRQLHAESDGVYGSPKIHTELMASGVRCGQNRVAKLMRQAGLSGCPKKRYRVKGGGPSGAVVAENLIQQNFHADQINERWASDITFISTRQGWLYLAVIMDLYSRRIVGWSMSRRINRHLALSALNMALGQRRPTDRLIHHSDRGAQYLSDDYQDVLKAMASAAASVIVATVMTMRRSRASSACSSGSASTASAIERETKPGPMCSTTSSGSTIGNGPTATSAIPHRYSSRNRPWGLNSVVRNNGARPFGPKRPFGARS